MQGVSFLVPFRNGGRWIADTLAAIRAQDDGRPMEVIVVDDGSDEESARRLRELSARWPMRIVAADGSGAAAALNVGLRAARFSIVCQVDQDVTIGAGWVQRLVAVLDDPEVAAVQGYFEIDRAAGLCARAMNLDLEQRYAAIRGEDTDHVCTGNTAYRASALAAIGGFDESLGYGYDNDVSYRLRAAGYRLRLCRQARAVHQWREGLRGYLLQQYGFGYGRIDVVAKHPSRAAGDSVSPMRMMIQPVLTAAAVSASAAAAVLGSLGAQWRPAAAAAAALLIAVILERGAAGISAARRFRTATPLVFPALHIARNLAWVAAIVVWIVRRFAGRQARPAHSMRPRAQLGR
jgi:cellulose synthase/poly-beta-1,6-N-acetylglucosamine synthase-like glycosyltransferase